MYFLLTTSTKVGWKAVKGGSPSLLVVRANTLLLPFCSQFLPFIGSISVLEAPCTLGLLSSGAQMLHWALSTGREPEQVWDWQCWTWELLCFPCMFPLGSLGERCFSGASFAPNTAKPRSKLLFGCLTRLNNVKESSSFDLYILTQL